MQAFEKTEGIGVAAHQQPLRIDDDGVDGADPIGGRGRLVDQRQRPLFMRNGDIDAAKSELRQRGENTIEMLGTYRERYVGAVDPVMLEPQPVQPGRERVRDRPADDAGHPRRAADRPGLLRCAAVFFSWYRLAE